MDKCEIQDTAILISRIIRGVQKALKEKINSPLEEIDFNVPPSKTSSKAKIEMLQEQFVYQILQGISVLYLVLIYHVLLLY